MTDRPIVYDMLGYPAETIGEGTQRILISPDRVEGQTVAGEPGLDLSCLEFELGYGQNEDQDAPYFAILLEVHRKPAGPSLEEHRAAHRRRRSLVFHRDPPVGWIHGLIDGQHLIQSVLADPDGSGANMADLINLTANLSLTPATRVLVREDVSEGWYSIRLTINGRDSRGNAETWQDEVMALLPIADH